MHPRILSIPWLLIVLFVSPCRAGDGPKPLRIHIIAGGEYDPVPSMTEFRKFIEANYRVECTTSFYSGTGSPSKLENLDSLKSADLLILFARRMALREESMKPIRAHWEAGKPIVGIRTACHAFQKADNEIIDRKLFGGDYGGPSSNGGFKTAVAKGQENHPVLQGVGEIKAAKYAYGNGPLADSAVVLQIVGRIKDKDFPVTWVNTYKGGRYFYTSLGSPDDFQQDGMKRLLANAVFWTTHRDPEEMATKAPENSSALARLSASLKPGTWAMLNKDGDDSGYGAKFTDSGIGGLFGYASKATYDPVRRRVYFFGSGHHGMSSPEYYAEIIKFIVYEVDKNHWTRLKTPQWYLDTGSKGGNSHGYQYQTIAKGQFFRMNLGPPARKSTVQVCNVDKAKVDDIDPKDDWKESVDVPFTFSNGPLEYFPERNSLTTINTRASEVYEWKLGAPKWEKLSKVAGMNYFGIAASYNPVHKVVVFGGGSQAAPPWTNIRKWYVLNGKGEVTPLDDSPIDSYAATSTLFTVDPVSGKHLLIRPNDFEYKKTTGYWFYELDVTQKPGTQWTQRKDLESGIPQFNARSPNHVFNTVVVPLPEYGVNMFMGPANVWIFKHGPDK